MEIETGGESALPQSVSFVFHLTKAAAGALLMTGTRQAYFMVV